MKKHSVLIVASMIAIATTAACVSGGAPAPEKAEAAEITRVQQGQTVDKEITRIREQNKIDPAWLQQAKGDMDINTAKNGYVMAQSLILRLKDQNTDAEFVGHAVELQKEYGKNYVIGVYDRAAKELVDLSDISEANRVMANIGVDLKEVGIEPGQLRQYIIAAAKRQFLDSEMMQRLREGSGDAYGGLESTLEEYNLKAEDIGLTDAQVRQFRDKSRSSEEAAFNKG